VRVQIESTDYSSAYKHGNLSAGCGGIYCQERRDARRIVPVIALQACVGVEVHRKAFSNHGSGWLHVPSTLPLR